VNQRRSTFNWVFHVVLPTFIHRAHLQRVRLIMVDGDPQQGSEVASALKSYMPNAFFGKCGYHIIHQGWKRHGPTRSSLPTSLWVEYDNFCTTVKSWLFSFMSEGGVEDEDEYELSKELLFAYLNSSTVLRVCDGSTHLVHRVKTFVRDYVIVYDQFFLYYKRKSHQHFNVASNSCHEGTNFGLKSHAASVRPSQNLDTAGRSLTLQGVLKVHQITDQANRSLQTKSLWSSLPTANHVTPYAESIIDGISKKGTSSCYVCKQTGPVCWEVQYKELAPPVVLSPQKTPIPVFWRLRTVHLSEDGYLMCDCKHFERTGIPCAHTWKTIKHHFPDWKGFTHHDVSPRWWSLY
jgi:hypothetical protein